MQTIFAATIALEGCVLTAITVFLVGDADKGPRSLLEGHVRGSCNWWWRGYISYQCSAQCWTGTESSALTLYVMGLLNWATSAHRPGVLCLRSEVAQRVTFVVSIVFCVLFITLSCTTNIASKLSLCGYLVLMNILGVITSRDEEASRRVSFALRVALGHSIPRLPQEVRIAAGAPDARFVHF